MWILFTIRFGPASWPTWSDYLGSFREQSVQLNSTQLIQQVSSLWFSPICGFNSCRSTCTFRKRQSWKWPWPIIGEFDECWRFLLQCRMVFNQQPLSSHFLFPQSAKIHYVLGLLQDKVLVWAEGVISGVNLNTVSFSTHSGNAYKWLLSLQHGYHSVADYSVDVWTLTVDALWNDSALKVIFIRELNWQFKDELATCNDPTNSLVSFAINICWLRAGRFPVN